MEATVHSPSCLVTVSVICPPLLGPWICGASSARQVRRDALSSSASAGGAEHVPGATERTGPGVRWHGASAGEKMGRSAHPATAAPLLRELVV